MNSLMLFLLVPFGILTLSQIFDSDDDRDDDVENEPAPEPEPEPETNHLTLIGSDGDDRLSNDWDYPEIPYEIHGGAGDDMVVGNDAMTYHASTHADYFNYHIGKTDDTLDGGSGDDLIIFDRADIVTGGEGADVFRAFATPGQFSTVTDFKASEDQLFVNFDPEQAGDQANPFGNVTITETKGDTVIRLGDEKVMEIKDATGLRAGYWTDYVRNEDGSTRMPYLEERDPHRLDWVFTDLQGNEVSVDQLDLIINLYQYNYGGD